MQSLNFLHQGFINAQSSCGVHQQHIKVMLARKVECSTRNVLWFLIRATGEPFSTDLCRHRFQLLNRRWSVDVTGDGQYFLFALLNEPTREFGRGGGFTGTL